MRRHALAMGAAVLAAVPVVSCETLPAVAEDTSNLPSWEQWKSLREYNEDSEVSEFLYDGAPWADVWKWYYSAVTSIVEGVYINANYEITPGNFSGMNGYYLLNGRQRFGAIYSNGVQTVTASADIPSDPISVVSLQDGSLSFYIAPNSGNDVEYTVTRNLLDGGFTGLVLTVRRVSGRLQSHFYYLGTGVFDNVAYSVKTAYTDTRCIRCNPSGAPLEFTTTSDYLVGNTSGGRVLLGGSRTFSALPENVAYPTITADNALDYVENVLNPYMEQNTPDSIPYLYDPNATPPEPSTYPVQETWASDAEWPEGNLLPTIPAASYTVEIPEIMTEGVSFWWRCLSVLFDGLGITAVVVGLLALGIVLYFVLR